MMFCIVMALVAGTALATVFALFTTSIYAAIAKSRAGIDSPVYGSVWLVAQPMFTLDLGFVKLSPSPLLVVAAVGFLIGASVIVWQFYFRRQTHDEPAEGGEIDQSEV